MNNPIVIEILEKRGSMINPDSRVYGYPTLSVISHENKDRSVIGNNVSGVIDNGDVYNDKYNNKNNSNNINSNTTNNDNNNNNNNKNYNDIHANIIQSINHANVNTDNKRMLADEITVNFDVPLKNKKLKKIKTEMKSEKKIKKKF
jgi:hypothetical protein